MQSVAACQSSRGTVHEALTLRTSPTLEQERRPLGPLPSEQDGFLYQRHRGSLPSFWGPLLVPWAACLPALAGPWSLPLTAGSRRRDRRAVGWRVGCGQGAAVRAVGSVQLRREAGYLRRAERPQRPWT